MDKVTTKKVKNKPKNKKIGFQKKPFKAQTIENSMDTKEIVSFLWEKQDFLRTWYSKSEYKNVILPMVVLTRLDIELKKTKSNVLEKIHELEKKNIKKGQAMDDDLNKITKTSYNNKSEFLDLNDLLGDPSDIKSNLLDYIDGFSKNIQDVFDKFRFKNEIDYLDSKGILWRTIAHFVKHEEKLSKYDNHDMGTVYEELIRKANEDSAATAGQFFTPRDIVSVLTAITFSPDISKILKDPDTLRIIYDPAAGTGGMLTESLKFLQDNVSKDIKLGLAGQESEDKIFAVCKSDLMMRGINPKHVQSGNTLTDEDHFPNNKFDYILSNPPYGSKWKDFQEEIKNEKNKPNTRYPCKLPGISDSALLFLQHIVSKMHPKDSEKTSRVAIIFNGSPLFTGDAGSGESEIRKWLIHDLDYLETIIALPKDLFYNTGIPTYVWILTNHKSKERKEKIQLINAVDLCTRLGRGISNKRNKIEDVHIDEIKSNYESFPKESNISKIYNNDEFGYAQITINVPMKRNYSFATERIELVKAQSTFAKLSVSTKKEGSTAKYKDEEKGRKKQDEIISVLKSADRTKIYKDCKIFEDVLIDLFAKSKVEVSKNILKTIQNTLSEFDDSAKPCMNGKKPVYDSELRDIEKVPLTENIDDYFKREVKKFILDAKIDDNTRDNIGYEIPINQIFYEYKSLRTLKKIDSEINNLQKEISQDLEDLMD
jgi:type I restriction enzyme M protein